ESSEACVEQRNLSTPCFSSAGALTGVAQITMNSLLVRGGASLQLPQFEKQDELTRTKVRAPNAKKLETR
ncbi:MAG: hypothetical protein ACXWKG_17520, partial [Limisphaerales bacterium]